jgi:acetyl esterase/lipase
MTVPVAASLYDTARCLQFVRYHAKELGLDKNRVATWGGSAGGAAAAWLALRDDLADPESDDPVARESTRVTCAIPEQAQTSLDPKQMQEWIPGITYGSHIFLDPAPAGEGAAAFAVFLSKREALLPAIREFSAYEWASKEDPPTLFACGGQEDVIPPKDPGNATHHPQFSRRLSERLQSLGAESDWYADNVECRNPRYHRNVENFLKDRLLDAGGGQKSK